jgi:hypothetical protein
MVDIGNNARIVVDVTDGQPLIIRVAGDVSIGNNLTMTIVGGSASEVIVLAGGDIIVGANAVLTGTFIATLGSLDIGQNAQLSGAAGAEHLRIRQNGLVTHMPYTGSY